MTNKKAAAYAIDCFLVARRSKPDTRETDMIDLITDLCHLAQSEGLRPSAILITAKNHWEEESYDARS
jgi:hypothetical protein